MCLILPLLLLVVFLELPGNLTPSRGALAVLRGGMSSPACATPWGSAHAGHLAGFPRFSPTLFEPAQSELGISACEERSLPGWKALARAFGVAGESGGAFRLVAIGGSETAGVGCAQGGAAGEVGVTSRSCAWPARLRAALAGAMPRARIAVDNYGAGGTTTHSGLGLLPGILAHAADADALLVDFTVNDAFQSGATASTLAAYEQLLASAARVRPNMVVVFVNTCSLERCRHMNDIVKAVASAHGAPVVSMWDLFSLVAITGRAQPPTQWTKWWAHTDPHPPWEIHQLIADTVALCVHAAHNATCADEGAGALVSLPPPPPATLSSADAIAAVDLCDTPPSFYSAFAPPTEGVSSDTGWALYEDRPGKPGWISSEDGAVLTFDVKFGARPKLLITYLRSYEGLARVTFSLSCASERYAILDGVYSASDPQLAARTSDSVMLVAGVEHTVNQFEKWGLDGALGWGVPPNSMQRLEFVARKTSRGHNTTSKFKIISVASC